MCVCVCVCVSEHALSPPSPAFHCSNAFGMEKQKISEDQISASSTFYDNRWLPRQARLNYDDNAWTPADDSNKEFIQVRPPLHPLTTPSPHTHAHTHRVRQSERMCQGDSVEIQDLPSESDKTTHLSV